MRRGILAILPAVALLGLALAGCSPSYLVTQRLDGPLPQPTTFRIGAFQDNLPADVELDDRPTAEDIEKFRDYLSEEMQKDADLGMQACGEGECAYEVRGSILEYKRGSGFLRFMIGFGAGSAKVVTELSLVDLGDGSTVFSGNFEGTVASWGESGEAMYKRVAKDFRKALGGGKGRESQANETTGGL